MEKFSKKGFLLFLDSGTSLYLAESILIAYITNWQFVSGRLFYHLIGDNSWIDFMQNDKLRFGDDAQSIKKFFKKISRWRYFF